MGTAVALTAASCGSEVTVLSGPDDDDDGVAGTGGTGVGTSTGVGGTTTGTGGTGGTWTGTTTGTPAGTTTGTWTGTTTGTPAGTWTGTATGTPTGSPCPPPLTPCGYLCVDTWSDPAHCGGCFIECGADAWCEQGDCRCVDELCGSCNVEPLPSLLPLSHSGSTTSSTDQISPSCGALGSPDRSFLFTAPYGANYVADTVGSSFDTVLTAHDPATCVEVRCDDDGGGNLSSRISGWLDAGQEILITVDGFGGDAGAFVLNLTPSAPPPPCPAQNLGDIYPATVSGSTSGVGQYGGSCGGDQAPELTYAFTAPHEGLYQFSTAGSSYDTLLHLRAGSCSGPELDCDDDGGPNLTSRIVTPLAEGQTVIVFVDGWGTSQGSFVLRIDGG
jgi:hypothetical protein